MHKPCRCETVSAGVIQSNVTMKEKLLFPSTNPIGRVFNDFINGVALIEEYSQRGEVVEDKEGTVTISVQNDKIQIIDGGFSVNYKTCSKDVYMELLEFVTAHMEYTETLGDTIIFEHPSGIEVYFCQNNNDSCEFLCSWTAGI